MSCNARHDAWQPLECAPGGAYRIAAHLLGGPFWRVIFRCEPRFTPENNTPKRSPEKVRGYTVSSTGCALERLPGIVPRITAHPGLSNSIHTRNSRCP